MLRHSIVSVVVRCTRHAWLTIIVATVLGVISGVYAARHFAINTDINTLISPDLTWRQREIAFEKAFPQHLHSILVVIEAPTAELTSQATTALFERLDGDKNHFIQVTQPGGGEFFRRNGLLFLPVAETEKVAGQLTQAEPLIAQLATDPSLRGLVEVLQMGLTGVELEKITLDAMLRPLTATADTVEAVLANKPVNFSWHEMLAGDNPEANSKRKFIDIQPKLDFTALEPGKDATDAIRQAVADLKLPTEYSARVRLTGPVAIADEEFATVQEGMVVNGIATVVIVLVILWLALKSGRIILAVFVNLVIGLAITAALGFLVVGPLNLISIAFAVLFVGLGVDFGIQYSVRYRADRFAVDDLKLALVHAARNAGAPLTLAAAATAAGFLSFLPTAYRGVSELGQIAGMGMLVAYLTSITLLPALLKVLNPQGEPEPLGFAFLAPVDKFMEDHRIAIIVGVAIVSLGGMPLLYYLQFDFNPINLRNPKVESIATFLDLRKDPITGANAISVLAPNLDATKPIEERLSKLPEVSQVRTLNFFVPADQDKKLAAIAKAHDEIAPSFKPDAAQEPPTDADNVTALNEAVTSLKEAAGKHPGKGAAAAAATRLSGLLEKLAASTPEVRQKTADAFLRPLKTALGDLQDLLQAHRVTLADVPNDIAELWRTADGRARVEVLPKGDPNDNDTLRRFARAVVKVQPDATGGPVSILESGDTIVRAFFEAGAWALISIAILLWIVLRRFGDVLLTIVPLLLAGVVTLELCVVIGMPLNFANIIALPLLLGIGVAFKIYYIMAWRAGQTGLLQSSLTRAVFYSALTTATAFGSLWLSSHPGTSSMGKLLALSLITTLAAAVLFQPVLMGKPRELGEM